MNVAVRAGSPEGLPRGFAAAVSLSILAHVALFGMAAWINRPQPVERQFEYIETRLVRWAPQERPKNQLPHLNDAPPPPAERIVAAAPPDPSKPADPKVPALQQNKASATPQDYQKQMDRILKKFSKERTSTTYEADGSPEGDPLGDLSPGAQRLLANSYLAQVSQLFRANWIIPAIIAKEDLARLEVTVEFTIDAAGKIGKVWVRTSSGDSRFDDSALAAVRKTATLPLPSHPAFKDQVVKHGLFYTFIPEEAAR